MSVEIKRYSIYTDERGAVIGIIIANNGLVIKKEIQPPPTDEQKLTWEGDAILKAMQQYGLSDDIYWVKFNKDYDWEPAELYEGHWYELGDDYKYDIVYKVGPKLIKPDLGD